MFWKKKQYTYELDDDIPLLTPVERLSFIVFDTETTGFQITSKDRLLEIGAVFVNHLEVTDISFQTYINPQRDIPDLIKELTGITEEKVKDAPVALEGIQSFFLYVEKNRCCALVAHCLAFDLQVIERELKLSGFGCCKPKSLDTMDLLQILGLFKQGKDLEAYAVDFGIPVHGRHTALGDAVTTAHLLCELLKRVKRRYKTWGELLFALESRKRASGMF
ncbi:hypothetical protein BHU72_06915 [Desulfuribacillus stibiiarsenatis]|uniref:Exonuclease domain-containing protein n=1 Tax=Desulfuribacillus stibiiarsenatis TaxID=1390249 RepID=A0A1E5L473_9FIRM|nr:3'-5' exonuclease [Desulfuribacillus stibiiarsenatis]OEH84917.1 hypothetical protein BHU72_06915 [Desulfuribacillus stibiiarsenatis]